MTDDDELIDIENDEEEDWGGQSSGSLAYAPAGAIDNLTDEDSRLLEIVKRYRPLHNVTWGKFFSEVYEKLPPEEKIKGRSARVLQQRLLKAPRGLETRSLLERLLESLPPAERPRYMCTRRPRARSSSESEEDERGRPPPPAAKGGKGGKQAASGSEFEASGSDGGSDSDERSPPPRPAAGGKKRQKQAAASSSKGGGKKDAAAVAVKEEKASPASSEHGGEAPARQAPATRVWTEEEDRRILALRDNHRDQFGDNSVKDFFAWAVTAVPEEVPAGRSAPAIVSRYGRLCKIALAKQARDSKPGGGTSNPEVGTPQPEGGTSKRAPVKYNSWSKEEDALLEGLKTKYPAEYKDMNRTAFFEWAILNAPESSLPKGRSANAMDRRVWRMEQSAIKEAAKGKRKVEATPSSDSSSSEEEAASPTPPPDPPRDSVPGPAPAPASAPPTAPSFAVPPDALKIWVLLPDVEFGFLPGPPRPAGAVTTAVPPGARRVRVTGDGTVSFE